MISSASSSSSVSTGAIGWWANVFVALALFQMVGVGVVSVSAQTNIMVINDNNSNGEDHNIMNHTSSHSTTGETKPSSSPFSSEISSDATTIQQESVFHQQEQLLPSIPKRDEPTLSGYHFKITVGIEQGFVDVRGMADGQREYSGYLIDILEELAYRADFTYELRTPSGYGSLCSPRLPFSLHDESGQQHPEAYHERYQQNYNCGESDVNDRPLSQYSTDMYWGMFYMSPERLKSNKFTIPFAPPSRSTLGMMGTATHIQSIPQLAESGNPNNYKVCAYEGTAYMDQLRETFPSLQTHGIWFSTDLHRVFSNGTCDILIDAYPFLKKYTKRLFDKGQCITANSDQKPIGVIGDPLEYGLNYFSFGIRDDLPDEVLKTLNFWLQALMACFPQDPNGYCYQGHGSISQMYEEHGGTGDECGYIQFPQPPKDAAGMKLHWGAIIAITVIPVILVVVVGIVYHNRLILAQEKRMKKRFIQQLARNIDIGPSAKEITPEKLAEAFRHISGKNGQISKQDLASWMNDLNLDFLSEKDFDRLWDTLDSDHTGGVDPIEFCAFLSECENQFKEVHGEFNAMPKSEKIKFASRRLSTIDAVGLEEVEKMERRNNRRQRLNANNGGPPMNGGSATTVGSTLSGNDFGRRRSTMMIKDAVSERVSRIFGRKGGATIES